MIWNGSKLFLGRPWTFTKYSISDTVVTSTVGFLSKNEQQLNLFRIMDIDLQQSFIDRLFDQGTLILRSPKEDFILENIKDPYKVKHLLNELIEKQQTSHQVRLSNVYLDNVNDEDTEFEQDSGGDTYI